MSTPENLFFTDQHEWVRHENGKATIGITDFAQDQLGDITYVELPAEDTVVQIGDALAVIESVKAAGDVSSPVTGQVESVNDELDESPEKINQSPYNAGWICVLKEFDAAELENLMTAEEYEQFLGE